MAERITTSLRARVRAEMVDEIKRAARRHLAVDGANLSLRAVARDLGMVSSAVYRYFPSRDELLTALIIDAYDALGDAAEVAEAQADRGDLVGRWRTVCHSIRDWAVANPHEYALIYGSPVPGYAAPQDTIGPASRPTVVLGAILADGVASGALRVRPGERLSAPVTAEVERAAELIAPGVPAPVLARGMIAWTELFGAISFDLFGRLNNVIDDRRAWFDHQVDAMAELVGLRF
ncbi:MAG: TetR/AcrR family transcriptional regulator [Micromonosporaceae bacterium]